MGQKINPISLRLTYTNRNFDNCWYSNYFYKNLINKDIFLQQYLNNFLKLLKLPTGRYSIQHLQKKTQVFNFFCNSKNTRQWRSKLFGLTKKKTFSKKTRYFFKSYTHSKFQNRRKNYTKLHSFYKTINQRGIYRIQKKITSFQNYRLWSVLQKSTFQKNSLKSNNYRMFLSVSNYSKKKLLNLSTFLAEKSLKNLSTNPVQNSFQNSLNFGRTINQTNLCQQSILIEKINQSTLKNKKKITKTIPNYEKFGKSKTNLVPNSVQNSFQNSINFGRNFGQNFGTILEVGDKYKDFSKFLVLNNSKQSSDSISLGLKKANLKIKDNSSLLFLQNLFVYKALKSHLKKKNKTNISSLFLSNFHKNLLGTNELLKLNIFQDTNNLNPIWYNRKVVFNTLDSKYKNYLECSLSSLYNFELNLIPFKVKNDWQHANFLAEEIVYFLQKRIPFRRLKTKLLKQLSKIPTIRGVRITCSGRVGGKSKKAQRAKTECFKYGQTSLQVFSSKIDFSIKTAFTSFGSVGVKVWICYY